MLPFCFGSSSLKLTLRCRFLCKFSIKEVLPGEAGVRVGEAREVTRGEDKQRPSLSLKTKGTSGMYSILLFFGSCCVL